MTSRNKLGPSGHIKAGHSVLDTRLTRVGPVPGDVPFVDGHAFANASCNVITDSSVNNNVFTSRDFGSHLTSVHGRCTRKYKTHCTISIDQFVSHTSQPSDETKFGVCHRSLGWRKGRLSHLPKYSNFWLLVWQNFAVVTASQSHMWVTNWSKLLSMSETWYFFGAVILIYTGPSTPVQWRSERDTNLLDQSCDDTVFRGSELSV